MATEDSTSRLDALLKSPTGVAAVAFAVSLSSGNPSRILLGSGIPWDEGCNGVAIRGGIGHQAPSLDDFVELGALGAQLAVYGTTLTQIAKAAQRDLAENEE